MTASLRRDALTPPPKPTMYVAVNSRWMGLTMWKLASEIVAELATLRRDVVAQLVNKTEAKTTRSIKAFFIELVFSLVNIVIFKQINNHPDTFLRCNGEWHSAHW